MSGHLTITQRAPVARIDATENGVISFNWDADGDLEIKQGSVTVFVEPSRLQDLRAAILALTTPPNQSEGDA